MSHLNGHKTERFDMPPPVATSYRWSLIGYGVVVVIALQVMQLIASFTSNVRLAEQAQLIDQLQQRRIVDDLKAIRKAKAKE